MDTSNAWLLDSSSCRQHCVITCCSGTSGRIASGLPIAPLWTMRWSRRLRCPPAATHDGVDMDGKAGALGSPNNWCVDVAIALGNSAGGLLTGRRVGGSDV